MSNAWTAYGVWLKWSLAGRQVMVGPPFRLTDTPLQVDGPAPLLGQHSQEVFCGLLGLSEAEVERLTNERVIY